MEGHIITIEKDGNHKGSCLVQEVAEKDIQNGRLG